MELKWLEDFASLARTGSFSRSAGERHVTQPAFSRRIRALEAWLGVALIDRSTYPTTLTAAGRAFRETAEDIVHRLHASRSAMRADARPSTVTMAIAALHSLALTFVPTWLKQVEAAVGPLHSRLLPDDYHACLQAIVEGGYDFLLVYHHPSVPTLLDPEHYPHHVVGRDRLVAVHSPALSGDGASLPLLGYAENSFLGRLVTLAGAAAGTAPSPVAHVNANAMADGLKARALEGHGLAWVPLSLVTRELAEGRLIVTGEAIDLEVRLYRNGGHRRPAVSAVWQAAEAIAAASMPAEHGGG